MCPSASFREVVADLSGSSFLSEERVRKGAEKLAKFLNAKQQGRLDGFFTVKTKTSPAKSKETQGKEKKRKVLIYSSYQALCD